MQHQNPPVDRLVWLAYLLLLAGAVFAFCKFLFRPLLPVAVAFGLSGLLANPTEKLHQKLRLPKGLCALTVLAALGSLLGLGGWLLSRLIMAQLRHLGAFLPEMLSDLRESLIALQQRLQKWFPDHRTLLEPIDWMNAVSLPKLGLEGLAGSLGWAATSLPDLLLTAVFVLASTILLVCWREQSLAFVRRQLPPRFLEAALRLRRYLKEALLGWLKAQGILMAVTFALLLAGLFLLRVQGAALLSVLVALMDALPVLGAGLALVPWALVELILGHYGRALGIAGLFAVILSVRNTLEPQLVGKQIGLHPLAALLSFFAGWRLAGLPGLLLGPILALILVKLQEWGYSRLWR
ncbi:MAG: AI-2E family transporter [Clostridia bacterium]|nr:AI-2E family transporter [Clostridia bacterium]